MLLGGEENYYVTQERRMGFEEAHRQAGVPLSQALKDIETTRQAVDAALAQGADCLVCMDDFICHLALILLREWQVSIPEDVSIVSFYDSRRLEYNTPPVASLWFDARALGKRACQMLLAKMAGEEPQSEVLPGYEIRWRGSVH